MSSDDKSLVAKVHSVNLSDLQRKTFLKELLRLDSENKSNTKEYNYILAILHEDATNNASHSFEIRQKDINPTSNLINELLQEFRNKIYKMPAIQAPRVVKSSKNNKKKTINKNVIPRETLIKNAMAKRLEEIKVELQNTSLSTSIRNNLIDEYRSLTLYDKQISLRDSKLHEYQKKLVYLSTKQSQLLSPHCYNLKPSPNIKINSDYKQAIRTFINNRIENQYEEFKNFYEIRQKKRLLICKSIQNHFIEVEKREEKEKEKQEKRRILALKENNMEEYKKLIENAKNERLTFLLSQTDEYLKTLGNLVTIQKGNGVENENENSSNDNSGNVKSYYQIAHSVIEPIKQLPTTLVGGTLKEYQIEGIEWMLSLYNNHLNGILADEMGLGKTVQTIGLLSFIYEFKHNKGKNIIIVPLSTISNWLNEFHKWCPTINVIMYQGIKTNRNKIYTNYIKTGKFDVLLTTYDYTIRDKSRLKKTHWNYMIIDEGHRLKNTQSKLTAVLQEEYESDYRLLLTGTPLQNNLPELWSLLNFLLPAIFKSIDNFENWFSKPFSGLSDDGDVLTMEERLLIINRLHQILRPFLLRREKKLVLDQLPKKIEKVIRCELSGWQKLLYNEIQTKHKTQISSHIALNNILMQLRKVVNHPYLFLENKPVIDEILIRSSGKFVILDNILSKFKVSKHRILIFSQMTQTLNLLEDLMIFRSYSYLRLDGHTSHDKRDLYMNLFNEENSQYFVFLLSTRAGGLGINLATADTVIIFDSDWNPQMDLQAQDRAHRIGQENEVLVLRLATNTPVENKILCKAQSKLSLESLVIDAGQFNKKGNETIDDKEKFVNELLEYDVNSNNLKGDDDDDDDDEMNNINELISRNDEEFNGFNQFDTENPQRNDYLLASDNIPQYILETPKTPYETDAVSEVESINSNSVKRDRLFENVIDYPNSKRQKVPQLDSVGDILINNPYSPKLYYIQKPKGRPRKNQTPKPDFINSELDSVYRDILDQQQDTSELSNELSNIIDLMLKEIPENDISVFMTLPSQQDYRSYYIMILKPISLTTIKNRINKKRYNSFYEFLVDIKLLVQNTLMYNLEGSEISMNALKILNTIKRLLMNNEVVKRNIEQHHKEKEEERENIEKMEEEEKDDNNNECKNENISFNNEEKVNIKENLEEDDDTFEL